MLWQLKQLEKLHEIEPEMVNNAINDFLKSAIELKEKLIIGAYIDGEINFGKVAELLGIHPVKLREQFLAKGIPVKIGAESKEEIIAEIRSAEALRKSS